MKHKEIQTLHSKSLNELVKLLESKKAEFEKMCLEKRVKQNKNTRRFSRTADDIARIATIVNALKIKERTKK